MNEVIKLRTLGIELGPDKKIEDHIRSEFTEIYSRFGNAAADQASKTIGNLLRASAGQTCIEVSTALFRSLDASYFERLRDLNEQKLSNGREDEEFDALRYAMTLSDDCVGMELRQDSSRTRVSKAEWIDVNHPDYSDAFIGLFDSLDDAGLIRQRDINRSAQLRRIRDIYNELSEFKARADT